MTCGQIICNPKLHDWLEHRTGNQNRYVIHMSLTLDIISQER